MHAAVDPSLTGLISETLEAELARIRGLPVKVSDVHRDASCRSSTFRTERLRVGTSGDERPLLMYLKDLSPSQQVDRSRRPLSGEAPPDDTEIRMYEAVLSPERFGTPRYYGSRWEPAVGRCWLFIEDVGDRMLQGEHDFGSWLDTCRWLAAFHSAASHLPAGRTAFLPVFDEGRYRRCAVNVERMLAELDAWGRALVRRALDHLGDRIGWLAALPRCVIHGQLFGQNVMLRAPGAAGPVSVIDWETAALGPGVFDLVSITSNKRRPEDRLAMRRAYLEQYQERTGRSVAWDTFEEEVTAVAVFHALEWLAWWSRRAEGSRRFAKHLRELDTLVGRRARAPATGGAGRGAPR